MPLSATLKVYFPSGPASFTGCTIYGYLRIGDPAPEYSISWRRVLEINILNSHLITCKWLIRDSCKQSVLNLNGARGKVGVITALLSQCFGVFFLPGVGWTAHPSLRQQAHYKKGPARRVGSLTLSSRTATKENWSGAALEEFSRKPTKGLSWRQVYIRP